VNLETTGDEGLRISPDSKLDSLDRKGEVAMGLSIASKRDCLRLCRNTIALQNRMARTTPPMTPPTMAGMSDLRVGGRGVLVAAGSVDDAENVDVNGKDVLDVIANSGLTVIVTGGPEGKDTCDVAKGENGLVEVATGFAVYDVNAEVA